MGELEELGETRWVKNSCPRDQQTPPNTYTNFSTHTLLSPHCPSSNLATQPFGRGPRLSSPRAGGPLGSVCSPLTPHVQL